MTVALLVFIVLSSAAIYPAYHVSRRRSGESLLLIFAPVPAVLVWGALTAAGIGAQSLSNIVEVFIVFGLGVVLAYVKVFVVDAGFKRNRLSTYGLVMLMIVVALVLRVTMPVLPE